MRASVREKDGVTVISVDGHLSFENNEPLKKQLLEMLKNRRRKYRVIFNLQNLNFVGSTGIKDFVKILKDLNKLEPRPRLCGLKREFRWMFNAFQGRKKFFMYDDENKAFESFES